MCKEKGKNIKMDTSSIKLGFISIILLFALIFVFYHCCELFGCIDRCKRRSKVNVIQVQQIPPELPIVAAEIQRDIPVITVFAMEINTINN